MGYINNLGNYRLGNYLSTQGRGSTSFDLEVLTTSAGESFTLPCQNVGVFNAVVDWGDGSEDVITAYNQAELTHTYATAGTHKIIVSGTFPNINFHGDSVSAAKVIKVTNLGVVGWVVLAESFRNCINLASFVAGNTDTSLCTNFSFMFYGCGELVYVDANGIDVSNAATLRLMFYLCAKLEVALVSSFDTSSCNNVASMFYFCPKLTYTDVSGWDTRNITNFNSIFRFCSLLAVADVSGWDTRSANDMGYMFDGCSVLDIDVSGFDISALTAANEMMLNTGMTTANYDATLIAWAAQPHQNNVVAHFGNSTYTAGGAAEAARDSLIADGWTITDGGVA